LLKVFQDRVEVEKADHDEIGDRIRASATDQDENMVDQPGQPQALVDKVNKVNNALKILMANATEEFGFAPRDVYHGVLDLPHAREQHDNAVQGFTYSQLGSLVKTFSGSRELSCHSHRVVAVYPRRIVGCEDKDNWEFTRIARKAVESSRLKEDNHLRNTYHLRRGILLASSLAGWLFEAIVHRLVSDGWCSDGSTPQPIPMG
jgi:hypothetical protein